MKKNGASINNVKYNNIQINTRSNEIGAATTTTTAAPTTTTTTTSKRFIFKSRQVSTATSQVVPSTTTTTTATTNNEAPNKKIDEVSGGVTRKLSLKRSPWQESNGDDDAGDRKKARNIKLSSTSSTASSLNNQAGAGHLHDFSDSDDDTNVFEVINTEKARQATIAKLKEEKVQKTAQNGSGPNGSCNSSSKMPETIATTAAAASKKAAAATSTRTAKRTNKAPAAAAIEMTTQVADEEDVTVIEKKEKETPAPRSLSSGTLVANGRRGSSNTSPPSNNDNNTKNNSNKNDKALIVDSSKSGSTSSLNGKSTSNNRKIILKRFSNGSNSDDDGDNDVEQTTRRTSVRKQASMEVDAKPSKLTAPPTSLVETTTPTTVKNSPTNLSNATKAKSSTSPSTSSITTTTTTSYKVKLKVKSDSSDEDNAIKSYADIDEVVTTPSTIAKVISPARRRSSTASNKSSTSPAAIKQQQQQQQSATNKKQQHVSPIKLNSIKSTGDETILGGNILISGRDDDSKINGNNSTLVPINPSPPPPPPPQPLSRPPSKQIQAQNQPSSSSQFRLIDDDDDDDLDDKLNMKRFKMTIRKDSQSSMKAGDAVLAAGPSTSASSSSSASTSAPSQQIQQQQQQQQQPAAGLIKNKIFNSRQNLLKSQKIPGFKIVFNDEHDENDDMMQHDDASDHIDHIDQGYEIKVNLASSSQSQHGSKRSAFPSSSSMGAAGTRGYEISSSSSSVELRQSRKAYECEELGEAQAFLDDLNYLIGGLSSASRLSERCLTLIKLGEQCLSSEFRMSLRSSSSGSSISCDASTYYLNRLCELLADSIKYKSFALCTCLIFYELTLDKLSIDIDQSLFNLVLSLIHESTAGVKNTIAESSSLEITTSTTAATTSNANSDEGIVAIATVLSDMLLPSWSVSTKASRSSSGCSSMTSSPISSHHHHHHHHNSQQNTNQASTHHQQLGDHLVNTIDENETDDLVVYKKILAKSRKLFEKISPLFAAASASSTSSASSAGAVSSLSSLSSAASPSSSCAQHQTYELNFATSLLALDCLLNLNKNTRNLLYQNETYKAELRDSAVLDKLMVRVRFLDDFMVQATAANSSDRAAYSIDQIVYAIDRYQACVSLLQTVIQPPHVPSGSGASSSTVGPTSSSSSRKLLSICAADMPTPQYVLNQAYLVEFKNACLIDSLKRTLECCYDQLIIVTKKSQPRATTRKNASEESKLTATSPPPVSQKPDPAKLNLYSLMTNLVKEIYLLLINLTHNNESNCERLSSDRELTDVSLKFVLIPTDEPQQSSTSSTSMAPPSTIVCHVPDEMRFDIQMMVLGFLLNLLVNSFKKKPALNLVNYKNKQLNNNTSSLDVILKAYLTKEALVHLAEDDHESELDKINEQIESQNAENINAAIMNSIRRAGKHMEDHIIAAHTALIIGYLLINDKYFNSNQRRFQIETVRDQLKDHSFQFMVQIIRKFIVFMNIMKVSGFSADEHIEIILKNLDEFDHQ